MKVVSMRGKEVDMTRLMSMNERVPAVSGPGGVRMNARGDRLGDNGEVIKSRETVAREYHASPRAVKVKQVSIRDLAPETFETPAQAVAAIEKKLAIEPKAQEAAKNQEPVRKRKIEDKED